MADSRSAVHGFAVMGHRGAKGYAPENTMASFRRGLELGANMLELDVHVTADKHLVVIHDATVDRTTDGSGLVSEMTLAQIQALDAGAWYKDEFAGERVPTFEQVVELAKGRAALNVELKAGGIKPNTFLYPDVVRLVADVLKAYDMVDQVVISSFHEEYLRQFKELLPDIHCAFVHQRPVDNLFERVRAQGWESVHTAVALIDEAFVAAAHAAGLKVRAWTPNDEATMRRLVAIGVDGIITDYPDVCRRIAAARLAQ